MMRKVLLFLDKYFFAESRSLNLGLLRIALTFICVYRAWRDHYLMQGFTYINEHLHVVHRPSHLMELLGVPFPLYESHADLFAAVYYVVAICAFIGLGTRPALFLFALMSIYLTDITASRGFFNHEASLTTQVLLILAVAPGSTRFSLDKLLFWRFKNKTRNIKSFIQAIIGPPAPVWGFKTILILLACTYFTAGFSKLRYGGMEWLDGKTLTYYLDGSARPPRTGNVRMFIGPRDVPEAAKWKDGYGIYGYTYGNRQDKELYLTIGETIASNASVMVVLSIATVLFELSGFIILLGGWWRVFYLLGAIIMHRSIGVLMNLSFTEYQVVCFFLIDWWWVYSQLKFSFKRKLDPLVSRASALLT